jgi:hypothetical protein
MKTYLNRRQLLIGAGMGAIGAAAAAGAAPAAAFVKEADDEVEGSWYITAHVTETGATFDALYGFAKGGVFERIDGRNNQPALGTWKHTEDDAIVFSNILFNFPPIGSVPSPTNRNGAIMGKFAARVVDGVLTGTFTADGILGLSGFHRSGTFTGTRIVAEGP